MGKLQGSEEENLILVPSQPVAGQEGPLNGSGPPAWLTYHLIKPLVITGSIKNKDGFLSSQYECKECVQYHMEEGVFKEGIRTVA